MAEFDPAMIAKLVSYGRSRMLGGRVDAVREDLLDFAYETLGFDGDQDSLWTAVRSAIQAAPIAAPRHPAPYRQDQRGPGRRDPEPKANPWNSREDNALVTAPYRFTPVNSRVSRRREPETPLNRPIEGNLSAVLDVVWQVETPLLVGDTDSDGKCTIPFKLGDAHAIPGATLRGAIRAVTETIAFGRMFQVNRHQRFALRDFLHPTYKNFITAGQGAPGLQTGWLTKGPDGPQIVPCDWGYVPIADIIGSRAEPDIRAWIQQDRKAKFAAQGVDWQTPAAFTRLQPFAFKGVVNERRLFAAGPSSQTGSYVFSGRLPGARNGPVKKQFEYVFLDTAAAPVPLHADAWARFEITNCKPSQNKRVPDGAWKEFHRLYEAGGRVPVFFVGNLGESAAPEFSFGLTRLYRIPHSASIGDLLLNTAEAHCPAEREGDRLVLKPDFVEHLFGYVFEPSELAFGHGVGAKTPEYTPPAEVARKGRVAFGFATPETGAEFTLWPEAGPIETIMGAPKPSFAPFYLVGTEKDYSASGEKAWPQLAGRKRYLTRFRTGEDNPTTPLKTALEGQNAAVEGDVKSLLRFLAPVGDAAFSGRIRLHNVSPAELGALLWAISFGGDAGCRHLIGRGKAFGAGQIFARQITLNIRRNDARGQADPPLVWQVGTGRCGLAPWLGAFETAIAGLLGFASVEDWLASAELQALLAIARPRGWTAPGSSYLPYWPAGGRQGENFGALRKKTGLGVARNVVSDRPPRRLLNP